MPALRTLAASSRKATRTVSATSISGDHRIAADGPPSFSFATENAPPSRPEPLTGTRVAPSILSADYAQLGAQVEQLLDAGARVIHFDVMDGHFVPPITFGPIVVTALNKRLSEAGAVADVHLMIERPERHLEAFAEAGADVITIHCEATPLRRSGRWAVAPEWPSIRARRHSRWRQWPT
jgi:hypothetical protein